MWQNVGKVDPLEEYVADCSASKSASQWPSNLRNHLIIHVDCDSANRGLFAGLIVLVATSVSIIFLAFSNDDYVATGIWINLISELTLSVLMIGACFMAFRQLSLLDVNCNPVSLLDDLLLFMCLPCFFLYGIFSIVPAIAFANYMAIFVIILQVIRAVPHPNSSAPTIETLMTTAN